MQKEALFLASFPFHREEYIVQLSVDDRRRVVLVGTLLNDLLLVVHKNKKKDKQ